MRALRLGRLGAAIVVSVATFGGAAPAAASGAHHLLLSDAGPVLDALPKDHPVGEQFPEKRVRTVELSPALSRPELLSVGDILTLNLFDDTVYTAIVDRVHVNINGTVAVRARIQNAALGFVLLSTTHGRTLGSIEIPETGEHFHIQSGPDGKTHYLLELDAEAKAASEGECGCCSAAGEPMPLSADKEEDFIAPGDILSDNPLDLAAVDVMIVYTPAAREWADLSGGGIENVVSQAMERAQLTLSNSNTGIVMPLVHTAEVAYTESGCIGVELSRLRHRSTDAPIWGTCDGDDVPLHGYLDEVHDWRSQYGADLVALFALQPGGGGIANAPPSINGNQRNAFSVTAVQQAGTSFTPIHEMGHNLGAGHHKGQNVGAGPLLFPYSAGWRWVGESRRRHATVMTYTGGVYYEDGLTHFRVAHFSNPDIHYDGLPTGHPLDGDNARTLRESKHVIAAYRQATYDHAVGFTTQGGGPFAVLQGDAMQTVSTGASTTPVAASAPSSWAFIEWTLGDTPFSKMNPVVVDNVDRNMLLLAHFQSPQSLPTTWAGNTVAFGNMFDIEVTHPTHVSGFDVRLTAPGSINTIEVYLREGTSFGAENSSEGWVLASRVEGVISFGQTIPSHVDTGDILLLPGQPYGIYVHRAESAGDGHLMYGAGGPSIYTTPDMTLTTNCSKGETAFTSSTHFPREWNGTVHYHIIEPPAVTLIEPAEFGPTHAQSMVFSVRFSTDVVHFSSESNLIIEHDGTSHDSVDISGNGRNYTITIGGITGDGSFTVAVDTASGVENLVGQDLVSSVTSEPVIIDNTRPNAIALVPGTTGPTSAGTINFTVAFDESIQGIDPETDLLVEHDGTVHTGVTVSGSGALYTIAVSGIKGDGGFTVTVLTGGSISDIAGNPLATGITSVPVLIDNTPPAPPVILTDFGNGPGQDFTTGIRYFELSGTAGDDVFQLLVNGESVGIEPVDGQWFLTLDLEALGPIAEISLTARDLAGNESEAASITITFNALHDADGDGLTDQEEADLAGVVPADPLDPLLPRKDWFVSAAHGGDDPGALNGGGTEQAPWQSIARAIEQLAPLARENFPVRILLDDSPNASGGAGPVALYEEPGLVLMDHSVLEPAEPGGAPIHIRTTAPPGVPVVRAGHLTVLRGVTLLPAIEPDPGRTLLRIESAVMGIERVTFDGELQANSTGIHITGAGSSGTHIQRSVFTHLGTGILSTQTAPALTDNDFDFIAADGAQSRALAIRFQSGAQGKQIGNTPTLGNAARIQETGFNRFRGLPAGAKAIVFLDAPFDTTMAQYNDWGVYTEDEIRALFAAPSAGGVSSVYFLPYIPADRALEPGAVTGVILDRNSRQPVALPLGPGVETSAGPFAMAGPGGIFHFPAGALSPSEHTTTAKAIGYGDSEPQIVTVHGGRNPALRFLIDKQGAPVLAVNPRQLQFDGAGGAHAVTVRNSGTGVLHWAAHAVTGDEWLALESQGDTLAVAATRNPGPGDRVGLVRISSANATNGAIDITIQQGVSAMWADINGDGEVNAVDVQLVINAALGIALSAGMNADINGDSQVNAVDVQMVINAALGIAIG